MLNQSIFVALVVIGLTNLSAVAQVVPNYDAENQKIVYQISTGSGGIIQYDARNSEVTIGTKGGQTVIDCQKREEDCRSVLEAGEDGKTPPFMPDNPEDNPEEPPADDGGNSSEASTQSYQNDPSITVAIKRFSRMSKGPVMMRQIKGRWTLEKDRKALHKLVLLDLRKRRR